MSLDTITLYGIVVDDPREIFWTENLEEAVRWSLRYSPHRLLRVEGKAEEMVPQVQQVGPLMEYSALPKRAYDKGQS